MFWLLCGYYHAVAMVDRDTACATKSLTHANQLRKNTVKVSSLQQEYVYTKYAYTKPLWPI